MDNHGMQTDHHFVNSFMPHHAPPLDDWCCYHPTFYPSGPASSSSGQSTPVCDSADGVPCLVPTRMMPASPEEPQKDDEVPQDIDQFSDSHTAMCSSSHRYPAHQTFFSQVPCAPSMPFADEMWMPNLQCVPDYLLSSQESVKHSQEAEIPREKPNNVEGKSSSCCVEPGAGMAYSSTDMNEMFEASFENQAFPRRINDPNILPVVDLTKSEMEIFTVQDFKDRKLDFFQKKTKTEKSTVLVVCIDQGMCAAFHLPQESQKDDGKENVSKSAIPPFKSQGREYLSVKKSLDKVFPCCQDNNPDSEQDSEDPTFGEEMHQAYLNPVGVPGQEDVISSSDDTLGYEYLQR